METTTKPQGADQTALLLERVKKLESTVSDLQDRNKRVEADKGWETSAVRRIFITVATYLTTATIFYCLAVDRFLLNALIPATAYLVSTLSLTKVRTFWSRAH